MKSGQLQLKIRSIVVHPASRDVPPLRDRKEDVLALARLFISRLAPDGTEPPQLAADAVAAMMAYRWPGNVRELRNLIERAMAYAPIPRVLHARDLRITTDVPAP